MSSVKLKESCVFAVFLQMSQGQDKLSLAQHFLPFSVALIHAMSAAWSGLLVFLVISVFTGNACMDVKQGVNLSCSLLILVGSPKMVCPSPVQLSNFHGMYRNTSFVMIHLQLNLKWAEGKLRLNHAQESCSLKILNRRNHFPIFPFPNTHECRNELSSSIFVNGFYVANKFFSV